MISGPPSQYLDRIGTEEDEKAKLCAELDEILIQIPQRGLTGLFLPLHEIIRDVEGLLQQTLNIADDLGTAEPIPSMWGGRDQDLVGRGRGLGPGVGAGDGWRE